VSEISIDARRRCPHTKRREADGWIGAVKPRAAAFETLATWHGAENSRFQRSHGRTVPGSIGFDTWKKVICSNLF